MAEINDGSKHVIRRFTLILTFASTHFLNRYHYLLSVEVLTPICLCNLYSSSFIQTMSYNIYINNYKKIINSCLYFAIYECCGGKFKRKSNFIKRSLYSVSTSLRRWRATVEIPDCPINCLNRPRSWKKNGLINEFWSAIFF